jgi:hypothetical protein
MKMKGSDFVELAKTQAVTALTVTFCLLVLMYAGKNVYLEIRAASLSGSNIATPPTSLPNAVPSATPNPA